MEVIFIVPGSPHGKGRPQFSTIGGKARARTPEKTVIYENLVKLEYQRTWGDTRFPDDAALLVEINAYFDIPKSASNKRKQAMRSGVERPTKKPDSDNIIKSVCDSLNGIAYRDDAQIVEVVFRKFYGDYPRIEVYIGDIKH